ncbi:MAG: hypothetical protein R2865_06470 [Deinococcales bacterium]
MGRVSYTLAEMADVIITCLPSPSIVSKVMEAEDGVLAAFPQATVARDEHRR